MKKRLALILSGMAAAGVLSLALPSGLAQQTNQVPPTGIPPAPGTPGLPPSVPPPQPIPGRPAPPQPGTLPPGFAQRRMPPGNMMIRGAISALERAKRDLTNSPTDFDGHRQPALEACDKAILELTEALKHAPAPTPPPVAVPPTGAPGPAFAPAPAPTPVPPK